ncbi:MAG: homoserine kinase [Elainellaceae cyanobacterium]
MSGTSSVTVRVPATTANLGPGFDCIGAALTLYNQFQFSRLSANADRSPVIEVAGSGFETVQTDASNLAYRAFAQFYERLGQQPPPIHLGIELGYPLARGLGSSATAIVGGLVGANALAADPLPLEAVMQMAIDLEGHPDNVVPALIGGCRLATSTKGNWSICNIPWHSSIMPVVAIPDFELSTAEARRVLPLEYSRADAIFNVAHLGLLLRGLETGEPDWLRNALHDRIHQPYRQHLIPGYAAVEAAALQAGAYGLVISGAGPTLLALTTAEHAVAVESAMAIAWAQERVSVQVKALRIDSQGAVVGS